MNVDAILNEAMPNDNIVSITSMGHNRSRNSWNAEELTPKQYHTVFERICRANRRLLEMGVPSGPLNEKSFYFSRFILDFDFHGHITERKEAMSQLCILARSVLRNHFNVSAGSGDVTIVRSQKQNYHLHINVMLVNLSVAKRFYSMLRDECFSNSLLKNVMQFLDWDPVKRRAMRMVLTDKKDRSGASVYECSAPYARFSIRPSEEQYVEFIMNGQFFQCTTVISAFKAEQYEKMHTWSPLILQEIFPSFDSDSESSFSERSEEIYEPHFLLAGEDWFTATASCPLHSGCHSYALLRTFGDQKNALVWKFCSTNREMYTLDVEMRKRYFRERNLTEVPAAGYFSTRESVTPKTLGDIPVETLCYRHGLSVDLENVSEDRRVDVDYMQQNWNTAELYLSFSELDNSPAQSVIFEKCSGEGVRFSEQFMPHAPLSNGLNVEMIEASCGGGKTHYAIQRLKFVNKKTLVVAPREQLCISLAERIRREIPDAVVQIYKDKELNPRTQYYVCTVDSLGKHMVNRFGGYCFQAEVVLIDEIETLVEHCFYSDTLHSRQKRQQCINILSASVSRARLVLMMDRDISVKSRLFTGWALVEKDEEYAQPITIRELTLESDEPIEVIMYEKYTAMVQSLCAKLRAGRRVILFETSCSAARALLKYLSEEFPSKPDIAPDSDPNAEQAAGERRNMLMLPPVQRVDDNDVPDVDPMARRLLLIAGDSSSKLKAEFSRNPDRYVQRHDVDLLIHTSAVGVGISIDVEHFHDIFVVPRGHMDNRAIQQGVYRCRKPIGDRSKRVYHMCRIGLSQSSSMLYRCPTLLTAFYDLKDRLLEDRHAIKLYATLPNILPDGSMDLELNGFNLIAAGMFMMREMSLKLHHLIWRHEVADFDIDVQVSALAHDPEIQKRLSSCKRDIGPEREQQAGLNGIDYSVERRQKEALMTNLGVTSEEYTNSNVFQFRAQNEMCQRNMERLHCYLAIGAESPSLGSQTDIDRLEEDQETLKSHLEPSVFREASYISMLLQPSEFQDGKLIALSGSELVRDPFHPEKPPMLITEFTRENFRGGVYRNLNYNFKVLQKQQEKGADSAKIRLIVNRIMRKTARLYFGVDVIGPTGAISLEELNYSVAILPLWATAHKQRMTPRMMQYCDLQKDVWLPVLAAEKAETLEERHVAHSKKARK